MVDDFWKTTDARGDNRNFAGHRFESRETEAFGR